MKVFRHFLQLFRPKRKEMGTKLDIVKNLDIVKILPWRTNFTISRFDCISITEGTHPRSPPRSNCKKSMIWDARVFCGPSSKTSTHLLGPKFQAFDTKYESFCLKSEKGARMSIFCQMTHILCKCDENWGL